MNTYKNQNSRKNVPAQVALDVLKPRPRISGSTWADLYRYIAPGTSPEPGRWHTDRVPYMREPLDKATAHDVEKVVIMAASQVAKSELLLCVMGYYMDQEPSPQLMLQPTVETAESFSKERIDPTIQSTPVLADKVISPTDEGKTKSRSRRSDQTIRFKKYPGGYLALVGSNSPAGLASRPIRVLLCDEIDRYGSTQEGDPLKLAVQRTRNFANRKIVMVSTPTTEERKDGPTIYSEFKNSDQREFKLLCPKCGNRYAMSWGNVKWDKDDIGRPILSTARMECPHCGAIVRGPDKPNPKSLATGIWEAQNPGAKVVGYHLTALCSPWVRLADLVNEFYTAKHNRDQKGLQEFINLQLGEPWHEHAADLELYAKLSQRREWYSPDNLPKDIFFLTAGVDVQHDRLEVSIYGWGEQWESWGVLHHVLVGKPKESFDVWERLDETLRKPHKTEDGRVLTPCCTFVDSGDGSMTQTVYAYTKPRESIGVFASKGGSTDDRAIVDKYNRSNSAKAALFTLGVSSAKAQLLSRLSVFDPGPSFVHFTYDKDAGFTENFFKQLTAEVYVTKYERSRMVKKWEKIYERNEALDCAVYAMAAAEVMHPDWKALKASVSNHHAVQSGSSNIRRTRTRGVEI